ncbi:MAG: two-component system sensor histidine kinase NtrB [Acidobacteriota bacterium]
MAKTVHTPVSRRLLWGAVVFALFLFADLALFGWLIVRSLSQHEMEKILLETRHEAQGLADRIAGRAREEGKDLFTAIALEHETQTYIDSILSQRDIVQTVEIRDRDGRVVFRGRKEASVPLPGAAPSAPRPREVPPAVERRIFEQRSTYDVTVPIGDLGQLYVGISPAELEQRIAILRHDLVRQASFLGALTLGLLLTASTGLLWAWRRGRRLEEKAQEAERLAYVGTLASGLAHEIRNPLNSLNLNLQLLEEEVAQAAAPVGSRRLMSITRTELSRLERLVTDFLSYARPRPLDLEPTTAIALLEHTLEVLAGELQARRVRVEIQDRSGGAAVRVDKAQIGQLLLNLVRNALAAMELAGRPPVLRLVAGREERRGGEKVTLEVGDNGEGIPAEVRPHIFDLFYSTRKGGTGLGLAIVDRIARAHGGSVEVESALGIGTTFRVLLPPAEVEGRPPRLLRGARALSLQGSGRGS